MLLDSIDRWFLDVIERVASCSYDDIIRNIIYINT